MAWEWVSESDCPPSTNETQRKDKRDGKQQQQQQSDKSTATPKQISPSTSQGMELEPSAPSLSSSNNATSSISFEHLKEMMLTQTQQISDLKSIVENQRVMIEQLLSHRLTASEIPAAAAAAAPSPSPSPSPPTAVVIEAVNVDIETNHDIEQVEPIMPDCERALATVAKVVDRGCPSPVRSAPSSSTEMPGTSQAQQEQQPATGKAMYHDAATATNNSPATTTTSQPSQSDDHVDPPIFFGQRLRARAWLSDYDSIMDINGYDNFQRLIIAEAYMVGEAREWYCRTLNTQPRINWPEFKELFLQEFCAVDQIIRDRNQPLLTGSNNCENPINSAFRALDGFVKQIFDTTRRL